MIIIYHPSGNTARLMYIAEHIFGSLSGVAVSITSDIKYFKRHTGAAVNYSTEPLDHGIWIIPDGLLSETGHHNIGELHVSRWRNLPAPFFSGKGDIPFDIFAAAFYLLTSYEEYNSPYLDEHGRFDHLVSLAFRYNFLDTPVVDRWALILRDILKEKYPSFEYTPRQYRHISTFDIDHPYLYRYKGVLKNTYGIFRDILAGDWDKITERLRVIFRIGEDPCFEVIKWIEDLFANAGERYILFALFGKRGKRGLSTIYPAAEWHRLLPNLIHADTGLHPSYETYNSIEELYKEKSFMEKVVRRNIQLLRRHFLRYTCPRSFREALNAGFTDDYTLAFAGAPGFRSGTCVPYNFYDVERDTVTELRIHPTIVMDTTLKFHLKMTAEEASDEITRLSDECRAVGGDFTCLWHNSNLTDSWKNVFIKTLNR
ncbi:MAG: hypothetical protein LBS54_00155 [Dysgonamonadaceae bacterium]|jgi:hypothetical protein|nr:hypothetical protein [Dysgonamonadaceae bacterium]